MSELKTLKDITPELTAWFKEVPVVKRKELKQEAIKWIKEINSGKLITVGYDEYLKIPVQVIARDKPKGMIEIHYITSWIKHFFNITDDELE